MPVIGGWDSPESIKAAIARGETIGVMPPESWGIDIPEDQVVQPAHITPEVSVPTSSGITGVGSVYGVTSPGVVFNPIYAALGTGAVISDDVYLAGLKAFARDTYGSDELGVIRRSSEVLENEPSGIRPGTMERIVLPAWARNQRGSPI